MATGDNFDDWLEQFTYLAAVEIAALPEQQQSLVLAHKFAQATNCDGAGSVFYNDADMVDDFAKAFDELSEPELAKKIRVVSGILRPFVADNPPDWQEIIVDQCMEGAASQDVEQLHRLMQERFNAVYEKLENLARSKGWIT